jgi:hypothetical protein
MEENLLGRKHFFEEEKQCENTSNGKHAHLRVFIEKI